MSDYDLQWRLLSRPAEEGDDEPVRPAIAPGKRSLTSGMFGAGLAIQRKAAPVQRQRAPRRRASRGGITHEVTVHTVELVLDPSNPPPDRIGAAFARANAIFNPVGLRVLPGEHQRLVDRRARELLSRQQREQVREHPDSDYARGQLEHNSDSLDYAANVTPEQGPTASSEALEAGTLNRHAGEPTAYFVPAIAQGDGVTVNHSTYANVPRDNESIFIGATASDEVFAHELGHLLMDLGHVDLDGSDDDGNGVADEAILDTDNGNLMQDGSRRTGTELTPAQVDRLLGSVYVHRIGEPPSRHLGRRLANPVQRAAAGSAETVREPRIDSGRPLDEAVRVVMERLFGADFSAVRVQESGEAPAVGARAFTRGQELVFAPGSFDPDSASGRALLGHELTHVVQQRAGRVAAAQADGGFINADPALEAEADASGSRVARGERVSLSGADGRAAGGAVQRQPDFTAERVRQQLLALGVAPDEVGSDEAVAAVAAWPDARTRARLATLRTLRSGGGRRGAGAREATGRRRAYPGRIIAAWNRHLDDLGVGDPWPTILHFVDHIEGLARAEGFPDYLTAIREENMPTVRLAGAAVGVNPRNVYFAAAAQARMDRGGGTGGQEREAGHGHWVPAGGFRDMARDMSRSLQQMGYVGRRRPRDSGLPQGGAILAAIRADLARMHEALAAQDEGRDIRGYGAEEHREPEMRRWLLGRWSQIEAVPRVAGDAQSSEVARQLLAAMGDIPGGMEVHHGYGSIDPHGTDHAMGNAIDLYNGRGGTGQFHNFGVRNQYWPFVHYLIQEHGAECGLDPTVTPSAIHQLPPEQAQGLATLIREWGGPTRTRLLEEEDRRRAAEAETAASPEALRARRDQRQSLRSIRSRVRLALEHRAGRLRGARVGRVARHYSDELNARISAEHQQIRDDISHVPNMGPAQMRQVLQQHEDELHEIEEACDTSEERADQEARTEHADEIAGIEDDARESIAGEWQRYKVELSGIWDHRRPMEAERDRTATELEGARGRDRARLRRRLRVIDRRIGQLRSRERRLDRRTNRRVHGLERRAERREAASDRAADRADRQRDSAAETMDALAPDPEPFDALMRELEEQNDSLTAAFQTDRRDNMAGFIRTRAFQRWLETVSDRDWPVYDQPATMVHALDDVHSHDVHGDGDDTHFYGGHHWTISARENLTDDGAYRQSIVDDMAHRDDAVLEQILCIMAESEGGRRILFDAPDPVFRQALEARLGEGTETMLAQVHARVVEPFEDRDGASSGERASRSIRRALRDRGHYVPE